MELEKIFFTSKLLCFLRKPFKLDFYEYWSFRSLVCAIKQGDKNLATKFIIKTEADVDRPFGEKKETLLLLFTKKFINKQSIKDLEWIQFFIFHGADPYKKDIQGLTAYGLAEEYKNEELKSIFARKSHFYFIGSSQMVCM